MIFGRCKLHTTRSGAMQIKANFVIINTWHARWCHIRSTWHWSHWANGGKWPQNSPLPLEARRLPSNKWMSGVTPLTILNDSSIAARTSAQLMQQSHMAWNTIAYLWRQNVTLIKPDMWPPNSPDLNPLNYLPFGWSCTCMQFTSAKIIEFYLRIQTLPAKL